METKGKLIVLYGINNLGKTTQARMLVKRLQTNGYRAEYIKYPIYNLSPSGPIINDYLRDHNSYNLTPREAQIIYTLNRFQYEKTLKEKLAAGINIIAEDYVGTGLAWGIGAGVDEIFLKHINSRLLSEDIAFLFDGQRFKKAAESEHKHENDEILINRVREAHLKLGREFNWIKINANKSIQEIHEKIWKYVIAFISDNYNLSWAPNFIAQSYSGQGYNAINPTDNNLNKFNRETAATAKNRYLLAQRLTPLARLPKRAYNNDAGFDLFSTDYYTLYPGDRVIVSTGIKMAIPKGLAGLIWDKGGIVRQGIHALTGVVDSEFRGEIIINLINLGQDIYNIAPGQKVAQMLIQKIENLKIKEAEIKKETERGENRFDSSGLF